MPTCCLQGLQRRKEVATARSLLELMQQLAHVTSKVRSRATHAPPTHASPLARARCARNPGWRYKSPHLVILWVLAPVSTKGRKKHKGHVVSE